MWKVVIGAVLTAPILYWIKKYCGGTICKCTARLDGRVIIITGPTSGIGKALAFELAARGATLVLACRNIQAGNKVRDEIYLKYFTTAPIIYVQHLDLTSISSITGFAKIINNEFMYVYGLVNNAGVFNHPTEYTVDGYEITYQTNYLGPFILTHYLMPSLKRSSHARIVNVASDAHKHLDVAKLIGNNLINRAAKLEAAHSLPFLGYALSKLALVAFTVEFDAKISNTNVIINAVDPGNVETAIFRHFPLLNNPLLFALQYPIRLVTVKRPWQGCQTVLHALITPDCSSGQYLKDCKVDVPNSAVLSCSFTKNVYEYTVELLNCHLDSLVDIS